MRKFDCRERRPWVASTVTMLAVSATCMFTLLRGAWQVGSPGGTRRAKDTPVDGAQIHDANSATQVPLRHNGEKSPLAGDDEPSNATHGEDWKVLEHDELPEEAQKAVAAIGRAGVKVILLKVPGSNEEDGSADPDSLILSFDMPRGAAVGNGSAAPFTVGGLGRLFRSLRELTDISLGGINSTDQHLEALRGLTALRGLWLGDTRVTDKGLANLTELSQLRELSLDRNSAITDAGLAHIAGLTKMETLLLGRTGITDAGLAKLRGMTELGLLTLDRTKITDVGMAHLAGMVKLYSLALDGTRITDAGLKYLRKMDCLRTLHLSATNISDAGLAQLRDLPIDWLLLDGTAITDAGLVHFADGMHELTELNLVDTEVTKAGVDQLRRDVPRLLRIQAGSTMAENPATIEPATPEQIARLSEVLWWLPARTDCLFVSHDPSERLFGRPAAGEERAFQSQSTRNVFDEYMRPAFVVLDELAQAPLSLAVEAAAAQGAELPKLCQICVFEAPPGDLGDAFMASLKALGAEEEAIGDAKVTRLEHRLQTQVGEEHWTTLVARPRADMLLFANDRDFLAELLERMKTKREERALPEHLPEWKHLDMTARQWAMRHYTNAESPFIGVVYSVQAGDVAKVLCLCREDVSPDFARAWWPATEAPEGSGGHHEVRVLAHDLVELTFAVRKKSALIEFVGRMFTTMQYDYQAPATAPSGEPDDAP